MTAPQPHDTSDATTRPTRRTGRVAGVLAACLLALSAACGSDGEGAGPGFTATDASDAASYEYTIPAGAGLALDAGEPLTILPGSLEVTVGETIKIINEDDRGHNVGPWFVGAGETLRQEFTSAGEFTGSCTVHPSGELVLTVVEA